MNTTETQLARRHHPLVAAPIVLGGVAGAMIGAILVGNALGALLVWIVRVVGRSHFLWNWGIPALAGFAMVAVVLVCFEALSGLLIGKPRLSALPAAARLGMVIPLFVGMMLMMAAFGGPFTFIGFDSRWITEPLVAIGVSSSWVAGHQLDVPWMLKLCLLGFLALPFLASGENPSTKANGK